MRARAQQAEYILCSSKYCLHKMHLQPTILCWSQCECEHTAPQGTRRKLQHPGGKYEWERSEPKKIQQTGKALHQKKRACNLQYPAGDNESASAASLRKIQQTGKALHRACNLQHSAGDNESASAASLRKIQQTGKALHHKKHAHKLQQSWGKCECERSEPKKNTADRKGTAPQKTRLQPTIP
jgi:hypothetical protein